jgi:hypothetical protein
MSNLKDNEIEVTLFDDESISIEFGKSVSEEEVDFLVKNFNSKEYSEGPSSPDKKAVSTKRWESLTKAVDTEGKELPYWHPKVMAEHKAKLRTQERAARLASMNAKPSTPPPSINPYDLGDGTGRKYANIPDKTITPKIPNTVKSEEVLKWDANGQWSLDKSNYGPKGANLYENAANVKRKANNVDNIDTLGNMGRVKDYGPSNPNKLNSEMRRLKTLNRKQPVKTTANDPKLAQMKAERNKTPEKIKKSWDNHAPIPKASEVMKPNSPKAEDIMANQLANMLLNKSILGPTPPAQPTDEQMFGSMVVTEEMAKAAEAEWNNKLNAFFAQASMPVERQGLTPEEEAAEIERISKIQVNPGSY